MIGTQLPRPLYFLHFCLGTKMLPGLDAVDVRERIVDHIEALLTPLTLITVPRLHINKAVE
jgi:hypothetical protein